MTLATLIVHGRYWYDALTLLWVTGFFMVEMLLLFRNTLLGWAMTFKCLMLAFVFLWSFFNPPEELPPENVSVPAALIRIGLIIILGSVIVILTAMRMRRETVIVGRDGELGMDS